MELQCRQLPKTALRRLGMPVTASARGHYLGIRSVHLLQCLSAGGATVPTAPGVGAAKIEMPVPDSTRGHHLGIARV